MYDVLRRRIGLVRVHPDALLEGAVGDLGQRRVRVRREGEVAHRRARGLRVGTFLDQVRRVQADDVHP